jgi:hypothetical protein
VLWVRVRVRGRSRINELYVVVLYCCRLSTVVVVVVVVVEKTDRGSEVVVISGVGWIMTLTPKLK